MISLGGRIKKLPFYVTNLGRDRIILGITWFKHLQPQINWQDGTLTDDLSLRMQGAITQNAQVNKTTMATDWAIKAQKEKHYELPEQYQDYSEVFSEEAAQCFPPEREEDHEIKFTKDAPSSFKAHTYHMDQEQVTFMRK